MFKRFLLTLILVITIIAITLILPTSFTNKEPVTSEQTKTSIQNSLYSVKALNGKIAVFADGEDTPLYVLPSPLIDDLPPYDRELLTNGITVSSNTELLQVLEDYDN